MHIKERGKVAVVGSDAVLDSSDSDIMMKLTKVYKDTIVCIQGDLIGFMSLYLYLNIMNNLNENPT